MLGQKSRLLVDLPISKISTFTYNLSISHSTNISINVSGIFQIQENLLFLQ